MKVAIVGAGLAGLVSIKSCKEEGLEATCFELTPYIGGLWAARRGDAGVSAVYDHLITNFNKEMMSFSDYPMPAHYPTYLPKKMFHDYVMSYCERFDLEKDIKLQHKVTNIQQSEDYSESGCWDVTVTRLFPVGGETVEETMRFDAVMICVGAYAYPHMPEIPGLQKFKGRVLHSQDYTNSSEFDARERVLVVGNSHSGCDIATDLCHRLSKREKVMDQVSNHMIAQISDSLTEEERTAAHFIAHSTKQVLGVEKPPVYMSSRSGVDILKRNYGKPVGLSVSFATDDLRLCFPSLFQRLLRWQVGSGFDFKKYGLNSPITKPGRSPFAINDDFYDYLTKGMVKAVPEVLEVSDNSVTLSGGEELEVDGLIMATGYDIHLPMVCPEVINVDSFKLYKHIWPVNSQRGTLAVIGLFKVAGSSPMILELQARCAVQVFKGGFKLPSCDVMESTTKAYRPNAGDHVKVQFISYVRDLAKCVGCLPTFGAYWTQPLKWFRVYFGSAFPYIFRLVGPGSCEESWDRLVTARSRIHASPEEIRIAEARRKKRNDNIFVGLILTATAALYITLWGFSLYFTWKSLKFGWSCIRSLFDSLKTLYASFSK